MSKKQADVKFALVPHPGCVCEQCLMIGSRGFVFDSEFSPHGGRNVSCKCEFVPGIDGKTKIEGYDPKSIKQQWRTAREIRLELDLTEYELKEMFDTLGLKSLENVSANQIVDLFVKATAALSDGVKPTVSNISKKMTSIRSVGANKNIGYDQWRETVKDPKNLKLNVAKQLQHVKNSDEYLERLEKGDLKGYFVDMPFGNLEKMIRDNIGKGVPQFNPDGTWKKVEIIQMDSVVGYAYNLSSGLYDPVHGFTIRYSEKKGIHAVPKFLKDVDDVT